MEITTTTRTTVAVGVRRPNAPGLTALESSSTASTGETPRTCANPTGLLTPAIRVERNDQIMRLMLMNAAAA